MSLKKVTELTNIKAREFFLQHGSYCNLSLPTYFDFSPLLIEITGKFKNNPSFSNSIGGGQAAKHEKVNYTIQTNKDGNYTWRPLELIHPVLYVDLVLKITNEDNWKVITERFKEFDSNDKIESVSIPTSNTDGKLSDKAQMIIGWWTDFEQRSIVKGLDFKYLFKTDVANFYSSIYTHSISWALHSKTVAKEIKNRTNSSLIGVAIDKSIQNMRNGQTNGIPQGSVLMDFISEMILGYIDFELSKRINELKIEDYYICHYRDDYRVFTNSKDDSEIISRELNNILQSIGLQFNASKTSLSENVVLDSIKDDKKDAILLFSNKDYSLTLQQLLLKILIFSKKHPNSGQIDKQIMKINKRLDRKREIKEQVLPLISIVTDLMLNNPRSLIMCITLISHLSKYIKDEQLLSVVLSKINNKFSTYLGKSVLDIWLQRLTYQANKKINYSELLCAVVNYTGDNTTNSNFEIWNSNWINDKNMKKIMSKQDIINKGKLESLNEVIPEEEVSLFPYDSDNQDLEFDFVQLNFHGVPLSEF